MTTKRKTKSKPALKRPKKESSPAPRKSKQQVLIDMLRRPQGATIEQMAKALSWQPHTVRGTLSGALKKRLGLTVTSTKEEARGRVYRITDAGRGKAA